MQLIKTLMASLLVASALFAEGFEVQSPSFKGQLPQKHVFNGFGCKGRNISPALSWSNAPKGTKSFALTLYDPDAPTGAGWWHWVAVDIPADIHELKEGASGHFPKGAMEIMSSYGSADFGGACPPVGHPSHRYILTLHALDVETLGINDKATPSLAGYMIGAHTLAKTSIVAYYGR